MELEWKFGVEIDYSVNFAEFPPKSKISVRHRSNDTAIVQTQDRRHVMKGRSNLLGSDFESALNSA